MVSLQKGFFGTAEAYCLQDFESLVVGSLEVPTGGELVLPGEVDGGDCRFQAVQFGGR